MAIDPEIQFPDVPFPLHESLILLARRGSESHGTFLPTEDPNGIDDRDLYGVCVPPLEYMLGILKDPYKGGPWQHAESIKGVWDVVLDDVRKFVSLLTKQNPSCLSILWVEPEDYLHLSPFGKALVDNRMAFRAREAARGSFLGYANEQLRKMTAVADGDRVGDFTLSREERAYAAGIFDGEGHITITSEQSYCSMNIGITSTDVGLMEYIQGLFGGSTHSTKQQPNRLPAYRWRAYSHHAAEILRCMLPFLRIKYEQAKVAIEFADRVGPKGGPKLSDDENEARRGLARQLVKARSLPYMGAKRKALVEKHGFDCKNAGHLIRLLHMGIEYHETGELRPRRTWDREMLIDVKRGKWERTRVDDYAAAKIEALKQAYDRSVLPEAIDEEIVQHLLTYWLRDHARKELGA